VSDEVKLLFGGLVTHSISQYTAFPVPWHKVQYFKAIQWMS